MDLTEIKQTQKAERMVSAGLLMHEIGISDASVLYDKLKFYELHDRVWSRFLELPTTKERHGFIKLVDSLLYLDEDGYGGGRESFVRRINHLYIGLFRDMQFYAPLDIEYSEVNYQKDVIGNFNSIFTNYTFIKKEVVTPFGRLDILAKNTLNGRDVIIELKLGGQNGSRQLIDYAQHYKNPILVHLSEKSVSLKRRRDGIIYVEYLNR